MSRRNTREAKARRRAERERRQRSMTPDQGTRVVEVQADPRLDGAGRRNSDERRPGLPVDADGGLIPVEPDEAELEKVAALEDADPGDFRDLDPDDADLQAALTVLAVLADDISDGAELGDLASDDLEGNDLAGDDLAGELNEPEGPDGAGDLENLEELEDLGALEGLEDLEDIAALEDLETGQPAAEPDTEAEEPTADGVRPAELSPEAEDDDAIVVFGDDDEALPPARVTVAGATADPVKDYLKQIGKVALLNADQEVDLAKRIEAGLFAEDKLAG